MRAVGCDIVVLGASAGGVQALSVVAAGLPAGLAAPVFVVLHLPRRGPQALPAILSRAGALTAVGAAAGVAPQAGIIYVAPPDHHLIFSATGRIRLSQTELVGGHRPAVDAMFRSAAQVFAGRVLAVVLSGAGQDGAAGLAAVVAAGGTAVVQDPEDAQYASMPTHGLARAPAALIRPVAEIGALIGDLVAAPDHR